MTPEKSQQILERYLDALLRGDRSASRTVIEEAMKKGTPVNSVYLNIIWPIMVEIEQLARVDKISPVQEHMATRINRTIVDQLQNKLPRRPAINKKIIICCTDSESHELGAQMMADLFESNGWEIRFVGGGLTNEDIFSFVGEYGPDVLLIYGTGPKQAPTTRHLIDMIKRVNAWPDMRIMVSGGIFNRAEGLWEEIRADCYAATAQEAIQVALTCQAKPITDARTINKRKRKREKIQTIEPAQAQKTNIQPLSPANSMN